MFLSSPTPEPTEIELPESSDDSQNMRLKPQFKIARLLGLLLPIIAISFAVLCFFFDKIIGEQFDYNDPGGYSLKACTAVAGALVLLVVPIWLIYTRRMTRFNSSGSIVVSLLSITITCYGIIAANSFGKVGSFGYTVTRPYQRLVVAHLLRKHHQVRLYQME